jgi:hypothetical protein
MKSVVHIVNERASDRYWNPNRDPSAQDMFDVICVPVYTRVWVSLEYVVWAHQNRIFGDLRTYLR